MAVKNQLMLKIVELICAIVCLALLEIPGIFPPTPELVFGTFVGYIVILCALILAITLSSDLEKRVNMFICVVGAGMFVASGALIINHWHDAPTPFGAGKNNKNYALSSGSIAIINGMVFLIDIFLAVKS